MLGAVGHSEFLIVINSIIIIGCGVVVIFLLYSAYRLVKALEKIAEKN